MKNEVEKTKKTIAKKKDLTVNYKKKKRSILPVVFL